MLVDPIFYCMFLHVFVRLSFLFSLFCSVSDRKSRFTIKKFDFEQRTACRAPVCWSKYTTALTHDQFRFESIQKAAFDTACKIVTNIPHQLLSFFLFFLFLFLFFNGLSQPVVFKESCLFCHSISFFLSTSLFLFLKPLPFLLG